MKSLKFYLFTMVFALVTGISAYAQREITGTVYRDGEVAAGVTVEAHRSSDVFMTSFDGKYKIKVDSKSKYLKFTFLDESKRVDIENNPSNVIDFSFDGATPGSAGEPISGAVDLRTSQELVKAGDREFMSEFTMYDQFYKQNDFKSTKAPWRKLFNKYPKSSINIYIHGANMYEELVNSATDEALRSAYVDTLMMIYDQRIKYFDQKGFVLGRKGTDFLKYKLGENQNLSDDELKSNMKSGYAMLKEAIGLEKDETEAAVLVVFMQSTKRLYAMGELSKEDVAANYGLTSNIVSAQLSKEPESEKYKHSKLLIDELFQTSGAADCGALIALYEPKFNVISQDIDALKNMLRVLDRQGCTDSELFAKSSEKLYALDPSPEAAFNMARLFMKRDDFNRAKEYYQNAIAGETDKELLAKYYYELGAFTWVKENNYQQARAYARKSLENNPKYGRSLILIGDIYAQYSVKYGESDFDKQTLYWLAVDYYEKAKHADPDVFTIANSKINTYAPHFPDKETLFFEGFQEGQTFQIGSWINESTRTRARK